MKVFISSVISGFEAFREATALAISSLGYQVVRAEDFGASGDSPQQACLAAVREVDIVVLLLGARYGVRQASGLSATHEEYREALKYSPVVAFIQKDMAFEPNQEEFLKEVREWETGHLTASFSTEDELRQVVTRELHRHMVSMATRPVDEEDLLTLAVQALGGANSSRSTPQLILSLAPGPRQEVLRPGELESGSFVRETLQQALFGPHALFDVKAGTQTDLRDGWLVFSQKSSSIEINSAGGVVIRRPVLRADRNPLALPALIEEDIEEQLFIALQFAAASLDRMDSVRRLSHVGIVAALTDVSFQAWRTRGEHARNPNSMTLSGNQDDVVARLTPSVRARAEVRLRASELAYDLMVLLRRDFRQ